MLIRYKIRQRPNAISSFSHLQLRFSRVGQPLQQEFSCHNHLLEICLQECKKIQTHQRFDQMPETLSYSLKMAKAIHAQSFKYGISTEGRLGNSILDLYAKCGHMDYATKVFFDIDRRDKMTWNSLMSMKSRKGLFKDAMVDFVSMRSSGVAGNQFSLAIVLSTCAKLMDGHLGKQVHSAIVKMGFETDTYCEGALIDMYAKCGYLFYANRIFLDASYLDKVSWTAMISGFAQVGLIDEALKVFEQMQQLGHVPDDVVI